MSTGGDAGIHDTRDENKCVYIKNTTCLLTITLENTSTNKNEAIPALLCPHVRNSSAEKYCLKISVAYACMTSKSVRHMKLSTTQEISKSVVS